MFATCIPPSQALPNLFASPSRHFGTALGSLAVMNQEQYQEQQQHQQQQRVQYGDPQEIQYQHPSAVSAGQWPPEASAGYYSSHHASPTHGFAAYTFAAGPASSVPPHSTYSQAAYDSQHMMQPHAMTTAQWQSGVPGAQPAHYQQVPASQPPTLMAPAQLLSNHNSSVLQPAPRRTLTDADRRRMCLYHEQHPTKKQTEIGELFGVERSTVSKVLRQKEKYLANEPSIVVADSSSRTSPKRPKPKQPDLDRTLAKWALNQQQRGLPLTDDLIRNQARTFRGTAGGVSPNDLAEIESDAWLEKFKQKNHIGARASDTKRRSSSSASKPPSDALATTDARGVRNSLSTTSPSQTSPVAMAMSQSASQDSTTPAQWARAPHHNQSNASLSSAFAADTAASTSTNSPLFSPDMVTQSNARYLTDNRYRGQPTTDEGSIYLMPPPGNHALQTQHHQQQQQQQQQQHPGLYTTPTLSEARAGLSTALTFLVRIGTESGITSGSDIAAMQRVYERLARNDASSSSGEEQTHDMRLASIH